MKICIPTESDAGLEARAYGHFGSAPFFTIVDTATSAVEIISNGGAQHAHGQCNPLNGLKAHRLDAVVCRGMGKRALARLNQAGVSVLLVERDRVADIVDAVNGGETTLLTADHACGGHQHGHHHGLHN
ncbi:MAG: NifB/NifX family molybdenum-iron cluster-binding protein [Gemmatimonadales bacterium]|jgi:predicted Fe-Mo cluster-binding NifX family protein